MLQNVKPVSLVLGGTLPHKKLITNLQQRGFYVVLIDYLEQPPAAPFADEHLIVSTLDPQAVLKVAQEREAKLVISTCVDQANVTACYVAQKMGLPTPYSYETALKISNKKDMKRLFEQQGIPTAKYRVFQAKDDIRIEDLTFPLIVKPTDSNGSKGVIKVEGIENLASAVEESRSLSRKQEIVIEEYIQGREIGADCYIRDGQAKIILTRERTKLEDKEKGIQQIFGSFWPAGLSDSLQRALQVLVSDIARVFELDNCSLMIQTIIKNDKIYVIEFAPRIGGGDNFRIIQKLTGLDLIDASIDSYLGLKPDISTKQPPCILFDNYIYCRESVFDHLSLDESVIFSKELEYLTIYRNPGTVIYPTMSSNNRLGVFSVTGNTRTQVLSKLKRVVGCIDVIDQKGESMMRKDIYALLWEKEGK